MSGGDLDGGLGDPLMGLPADYRGRPTSPLLHL